MLNNKEETSPPAESAVRSAPCTIVVSACLAGIPCRYNATACPVDAVQDLVARGLALPLCPETLGGLSVPRSPCECCHGRVLSLSGDDCTAAFRAGVDKAMAATQACGATVAILKARSPSCGSGRIYDGTFTSRLVPGDGLWAAALRAAGLTILTEDTPDLQGRIDALRTARTS